MSNIAPNHSINRTSASLRAAPAGYVDVRARVAKLLLIVALIVLVAGLVLSAALNISVCAWGCPSSNVVYSLQASFVFLIILVVGVVYKLIRLKRGAENP